VKRKAESKKQKVESGKQKIGVVKKGGKRRAGLGFEACGYAAFLQNAGFFFRVGSQGLHPGLVCDAPLGHGIRNTGRKHGSTLR
jgi:hypothetical protein